jgi:hypothetical protein
MNQMQLEEFIKNRNKEMKILQNAHIKLMNTMNEKNAECNQLKEALKNYKYQPNGNKINYYDSCLRSQAITKNDLNNILMHVNEDISKSGVKFGDCTMIPADGNFQSNVIDERIEKVVISAERALYIKDKKFFTDDDYKTIFYEYFADIPSFDEVLNERNSQNEDLFKELIRLNKKCYFVNVKEKIKKHVENFLKFNKYSNVRIKFCIDGTQVSRNVNLVNFCFTILDDKNSTSCFGHHTLGIGAIQETYEDLKLPLDYIMSVIAEFQELEFKGNNITIEYFLAADYKLLLTLLGILFS